MVFCKVVDEIAERVRKVVWSDVRKVVGRSDAMEESEVGMEGIDDVIAVGRDRDLMDEGNADAMADADGRATYRNDDKSGNFGDRRICKRRDEVDGEIGSTSTSAATSRDTVAVGLL